MKHIIGLFTFAVFVSACAGNGNQQQHQHDSLTAIKTEPQEVQYDTALVANLKDPVCRMPIRIGVYDTAHYHGTILGFCSASCKDTFLLKPENYKLVMK
ncbi:YHS domain-containing protein [Chitinophaga sp. Mgbs1]|uniref:YHS domain-containing protein n=1 Tax=Chitinophaga solisilvae TaxID=1233460 RepID=A0A3S1CYK7_9BACT|nr:YHS domain-containing protein [Chitinophaga solisilvae]